MLIHVVLKSCISPVGVSTVCVNGAHRREFVGLLNSVPGQGHKHFIQRILPPLPCSSILFVLFIMNIAASWGTSGALAFWTSTFVKIFFFDKIQKCTLLIALFWYTFGTFLYS